MARRATLPPRKAVTSARVARLYRLLKLLTAGPSSRETLLRQLGLNQRGFYRDVEVLRTYGIVVRASEGRYALVGGLDDALNRLPLPDPRLTLGQALVLARGSTAAHKALTAHISRLIRSR